MTLTFPGIRTFLRSWTSQQPQTAFVVVGLPSDCATSHRPGARMAPAAIRHASLHLVDGVCDDWPVDVTRNLTDLGDANLSTGNLAVTLTEIQQLIAQLHAGEHHVVAMGGDHSVTLGILRGMHHRYPGMACVHLDAHCDTWQRHGSQPQGHGTWLRNAIEEGLVDPEKTVSIGVRSPADNPTRFWLNTQGGLTISARSAMRAQPYEVFASIRDRIGDTPCYFTLDIDVLDPAHAPGTGTPEIGGLTSMWVDEFIDCLHTVNLVGMDCVEVAPAYDHSDITSLAAATFMWRYLSMQIHKNLQTLID